ncbi:MAG: rod shape-determining protein RodA [Bacillota bacterium]|nr:rod shape-determining protein RodA [Bacillota bacterium]MDW7683311.1 rod shape-determining protein RodA [Bacillota bacterium]
MEKLFDRRLFRHFDYLLLLTIFTIMLVSLLVIFSTTRYNLTGDPFYYMKRQAIWFGVSLSVMFVITSIDYTQFYKISPFIYGLNAALLLAVIFLGKEGGGAQRWIDLKFFNLQPSEFAKLIIIITLARHLAAREGYFESALSVIPAFLHVAVPIGLIFLQPDLGTSIVFIAILFGMLYMAGAKFRHLFSYAAAGVVVGFPLLWFNLKDYQRLRLIVFMNPEVDKLGSGYQIIQSMIAVGSGGLWGKGLFSLGTQNELLFLSEHHTDFIFSALAEETGFIGGVILILLFTLLIFRVLRIAVNAKDTYGMLICIGVATMLTFQVLINIGMTIGMMPVTGLPLPFMSYGGSSLLMNMMAMGVVLGIGMRRHKLMF